MSCATPVLLPNTMQVLADLQDVPFAWLQAVSMTRVRFFAVPDLAAQDPAEQHWYCIDDATIASPDDLAELVVDEGKLPPTTALWLLTEDGWEQISRLAEVLGGNLVLKAVLGESGGHTLCYGVSQVGCGHLLATLQRAKILHRHKHQSGLQVCCSSSCASCFSQHGTVVWIHAAC